MLLANDLSKTGVIILCHLSDGHSDEKRFVQEVQEQFGIAVAAANKNVTVNLTKVC